MKMSISAFVLSLLTIGSIGQVQIDQPIQLNGGNGQRKISGLELPTANTDAASKEYVDTEIAGAGGGSCAAAPGGQTLINFNGCLYVKNTDESGNYTWANALTACTALGAGWYLPAKMELDVLFQNSNNPANGTTCFGGTCALSGFNAAGIYWSSTPGSSTAWMEYFSDGFQDRFNKTYASGKVRCVRR